MHRWDITPPTPPTPPAGGPTTSPLASTTDKNFCHGHVRFDKLRREQKRRESGSNGEAAIETATAPATKASQQEAPRQLCLGTFSASILPGGRSSGHGCTGTCAGRVSISNFLRLLNDRRAAEHAVGAPPQDNVASEADVSEKEEKKRRGARPRKYAEP